MKRFLVSVGVLFAYAVLTAQPVISSFSPKMGPPASLITINGSGFSFTPADNIVFFGATRAVVNTASSNQLVVVVPAGASHAPLSVTTNNLVGFSQSAFNPATGYGSNHFSSASFDAVLSLNNTGQQAKYAIHVHDLGGDGKPDIIGADSISNGMLLIGNISFPGYLNNNSFIYNQPLNVGGFQNYIHDLADFNGDGKIDLAIGGNAMRIFTNVSSGANISFSGPAGVSSIAGSSTMSLATGDVDNDGKTDIVRCINYFSDRLQVLKNTTQLNQPISFDTLPGFPFPEQSNAIESIVLADIDGDSKLDIVYCNNYYNTLHVLLNITTENNIRFGNPAMFTVGQRPKKIVVADIDDDGLKDIICGTQTGTISVFKNNSSPGNLSLAAAIDLPGAGAVMDMCAADLDGDGKTDIACTIFSSNGAIGLFKNNSSLTAISFASAVNIPVPYPYGIACADIDRDGLQDLIVGGNYAANKLGVFRNLMLNTVPFELCPGGTTTLQSNFTGISHQWEMSMDSINFTALTDDTTFSGALTHTLQMNNLPTSWYGYQLRCIVNFSFNRLFTLTFKNTWTGVIDSTWENPANWSCNVFPDVNTDVVIPSGSTVVLASNVSCRSIKIATGASFTVAPGFALTVTH